MWYLIRAAVKNVRINLGQLRNKRQIDSQLCDSICAAYVQACSHQPQALAATENCFKFLMLQKILLLQKIFVAHAENVKTSSRVRKTSSLIRDRPFSMYVFLGQI